MNGRGTQDKIWRYLRRHFFGLTALLVIVLFCLVGIYAPFFASSKPLFVVYDGTAYFPLFRYLLTPTLFTKGIDLFFNLLMLTFPLFMIAWWQRSWLSAVSIGVLQMAAFWWLLTYPLPDPASSPKDAAERQQQLKERRKKGEPISWWFDLQFLNPYARLNLILDWRHQRAQHSDFLRYFPKEVNSIPSLWHIRQMNEKQLSEQYLQQNTSEADASLTHLHDRRQWLEEQSQKIDNEVMPLFSHFHWEDDAGGSQSLNQHLSWWKMTRINRKDLSSALIFGIRISLVVGILAVVLSLSIAIPIGALAGYYGSKMDLVVCRLLEIWESMPVFFMLLLVVAMVQSKSVFLVIAVVGLFGWPGFSRYIRGEFFKQRHLPYVEACRAIGFHDSYIIFSHILPNALPPVLTLLPFAMMGAISSEAGLSFLGLGEEGSCSWGVLMDEGRRVFPGESYLLWPPAALLTILLIAIALLGDALRDALDPKMQR